MKELTIRLEMVEAQNAVLVALVGYLLKSQLAEFEEPLRSQLRESHMRVAEMTIAGLLASDSPDHSAAAVERMKEALFS